MMPGYDTALRSGYALFAPPWKQARAHQIKEIGQAEAETILAKGEAEAKVRRDGRFELSGVYGTSPPSE